MSFYSMAKFFVTPLGRFLFQVKFDGAENMPEHGPVILCSNHLSVLDPFILGLVVERPLFFMAKAELFRIPLFNLLIKALGAFPVHRGQGDKEAIKKSLSLLKEGKVVAMFPEGTRLREGRLPQKFKPGAAMMAYRSHAPIVPAVIIRNGKAGLFRRNRVRIGQPMRLEELSVSEGSFEELRRVSGTVREKVIGLMGITETGM